MTESVQLRYSRLQLDTLMDRYPDLRIVPTLDDTLRLRGSLGFNVTGPDEVNIEDEYDIELYIKPGFPNILPLVRETGQRIPRTHHKLQGGWLCLAAPTEIRLILRQSPTLLTLVESLVIPYLYSYSFLERHGRMPYGDLLHGDAGIRQYLASLFDAAPCLQPERFLWLGSMKKRDANKRACPCGSGRRLGRCHNRSVNTLRRRLGRSWFCEEWERVSRTLDPHMDPIQVTTPPIQRLR